MKKYLIILVLVGILMGLGYWNQREKVSELNELLQDSDYTIYQSGRVINEKMNFSFKKPVNWKIDFQDNILSMFSEQEKYEVVDPECPEIRKGCTIEVRMKDNYQDKKKLIKDIENTLETGQNQEILEGIKEVYTIHNINGFQGVQEFVSYAPEIGYFYDLHIPALERNYSFSTLLKKECLDNFQEFIKTIKIN